MRDQAGHNNNRDECFCPHLGENVLNRFSLRMFEWCWSGGELLSILVYELNSSGDLVSLFHLFSIDERNTVNDLGEVREAA